MKHSALTIHTIQSKILFIRGIKVMLDSDLAQIYGVPTRRLNEQVKRNRKRFPDDFSFRLTKVEFETLLAERNRSHFAMGSQKHRDPRFLPSVFTEHGALMAANILHSNQAIQTSVFVVRAFVRMRSLLTDRHDLARKLAALEKELKGRLNIHEAAIVGVLQRVMEILDPSPLPEPKRSKIGFK